MVKKLPLLATYNKFSEEGKEITLGATLVPSLPRFCLVD